MQTENEMPEEVIDIHLHFGAPNDPDSPEDGCYWSEKFTKSVAFLAMRLVTHSWFGPLTFKRVKKHLLKVIHAATQVQKCVLLAIDKVYDENGTEHLHDLTHLYVPNHTIAELARENDRILFGCSVHPFNPHWEEQIDFSLAHGAVLCKWLPSAQMIDPSHPRCIPFYEKLAHHQLPLLFHTGPELSIPTSDARYNQFNNPIHMRQALGQGVKVIFAHCALPFAPEAHDRYEPYLELIKVFQEADRKGWEAYADLSALFILRELYIPYVVEDLPVHRLLLGSDYPIPMIGLPTKKKLSVRDWLAQFFEIFKKQNPIDRNFQLLKDQGFSEIVFTRAAEIFSQIKRS
jgi:predicted TIM-barrel fold metal-dependent hydrolase